ncbi:MAG: hypothetical protein AAF355_11515 [Myxococcota bacterium]
MTHCRVLHDTRYWANLLEAGSSGLELELREGDRGERHQMTLWRPGDPSWGRRDKAKEDVLFFNEWLIAKVEPAYGPCIELVTRAEKTGHASLACSDQAWTATHRILEVAQQLLLYACDSSDRSISGFVGWYNHTANETGRSYLYTNLSADQCIQFLPRSKPTFIPSLAPQLTFTLPLERVAAFLDMPPWLSDQFGIMPPVGNYPDQVRVFTQRRIEQISVELVRSILQTFRPEKWRPAEARAPAVTKLRAAQKLHGFLALLSYQTLFHLSHDEDPYAPYAVTIDRGNNRGRFKKDMFRFLPKANLAALYNEGLSVLDQDYLKRLEDLLQENQNLSVPEYMIRRCLKALGTPARGYDASDHFIKREIAVSQHLPCLLAAALSGAEDEYTRKLEELDEDQYTLVTQYETGVLKRRDDGRQMVGFEYRAFSHGDRGSFPDVNTLMSRYRELRSLLRIFFRTSVYPKRLEPDSGAYWGEIRPQRSSTLSG